MASTGSQQPQQNDGKHTRTHATGPHTFAAAKYGWNVYECVHALRHSSNLQRLRRELERVSWSRVRALAKVCTERRVRLLYRNLMHNYAGIFIMCSAIMWDW